MEQKDPNKQKYVPIKKCVVPNCDTNSVSSPLEKFVYFPKYGCEIFYEWIKIIGLPDLGHGHYFICRKHFPDDCFGQKKVRITKNSKPSLLLSKEHPENVNIIIKTYGNPKRKSTETEITPSKLQKNTERNKKNSLEKDSCNFQPDPSRRVYMGPKTFAQNYNFDEIDEIDLLNPLYTPNETALDKNSAKCTNCDISSSLLQFWKNKYIKLVLKMKRKSSNITKASKKVKYLVKKPKQQKGIKEQIDRLHYVSENLKFFSKMVLRPRKKKSLWPQQERHLCLSLFLRSPSYYKFLKQTLDIKLPSISSLHSWLPIQNVKPGINEELFEYIKKIFSAKEFSDKDKLGVLVFDEIRIRSELEYNSRNDLIDGVCTDGIVQGWPSYALAGAAYRTF